MTSSTNKINTMMEAVKPQASTPNFVLTLLAACSNSVPAAGQEGEATLSDQLSGLLQDKAMAVEELNLLYGYKFGLSISDALKFAGFVGGLYEFLDEQKCFSVDGGLISLKPVTEATIDEAPADDKPLAEDEVATQEDCALAIALDFRAKCVDSDAETASVADTESTTDAESNESDGDSDIDIDGWHSIGNRLVAALGSSEADADGVGWKALGGRVAAALSSDEEDGEDVAAWCEVGHRIARACSPDLPELGPDAIEWHSVGARVLRSLDSAEPEADPAEWHSVGARVRSCLEAERHEI